MFWLRKPCLQRMSTLGILSLIGKLSPQPKRPSHPMLAQQSPHWSCTLKLTLLGLHQLQSELVGKSGDALPAAISSYLIANRQTRRWQANLATTGHAHCRTPAPWPATTLTPEPPIFPLLTCSAEHAPHSHVQDTSSHLTTWSVQNSCNQPRGTRQGWECLDSIMDTINQLND